MGEPTPGKSGAAEHLFSDSDIRIEDNIKHVKPEDGGLLKHIPDQFLSEEQKAAKERALSKQEKEYAEMRVNGNVVVPVAGNVNQ